VILTFNELGLEPLPSPAYTRAWVINDACDYIMRHYFPCICMAEEDAIPNPRGALVDYAAKIVVIRTAAPVIH